MVASPPKRPFITTRRLYAAGIAFAAVLAILRMFGMSLNDFAHLARQKFTEAAADARAATAKAYAGRYSQKLREEAARIPIDVPLLTGKESAEISRDIQRERQRILEERADHLEKVGEGLRKGDLGSLSKQVEENARKAAGNH